MDTKSEQKLFTRIKNLEQSNAAQTDLIEGLIKAVSRISKRLKKYAVADDESIMQIIYARDLDKRRPLPPELEEDTEVFSKRLRTTHDRMEKEANRAERLRRIAGMKGVQEQVQKSDEISLKKQDDLDQGGIIR